MLVNWSLLVVPPGVPMVSLPSGPTGRLGLRDAVGSGPQIAELIEPGAVGRRGQMHGARVVGAVEVDGGARDAGLAGLLDAVVETALADVAVDETAELTQADLPEVVVHAVEASGQVDVGELVAGGAAAGRADGVLAVDPTGRLSLRDDVGSRVKVAELVEAAAVGRRGLVDGAGVVHAIEVDGGAGDAGFTGLLDAVVEATLTDVAVDEAAELSEADLAKVVVDASDARRQIDVGELVVVGSAAGRADGVLAVGPAGGLRLRDGVSSGQQIGELVETTAIGGGG